MENGIFAYMNTIANQPNVGKFAESPLYTLQSIKKQQKHIPKHSLYALFTYMVYSPTLRVWDSNGKLTKSKLHMYFNEAFLASYVSLTMA